MEFTKTIDDNAAMLSLSGAFDTLAAAEFAAALGELTAVLNLVLDLEKVTYITPSGLLQLAIAQKKWKEKLTLIRVPAEVAESLRMTGLYERLNILS